MSQVTQLECDQCHKTAALDEVDDWWNLQLSRRGATSPYAAPGLSPADAQMAQQMTATGQIAGAAFTPGVVPFPVEPVFGAPVSVDVCSTDCAVDYTRERTKEPPKAEATPVGVKAEEG